MSSAATTKIVFPGQWAARAACKGHTHLFYPPVREQPDQAAARTARARELCFACPVRIDCRDHARTHREYGIWGGETEAERAALGYAPPIGLDAATRAARSYRTAAGT